MPEGDSSLNCRAHAMLVDRDGDGVEESFAAVQAGAPVCFRATLQIPVMPATDRPLAFLLRAGVQADGSESATRRIWLVVPPATEGLSPNMRDSVAALVPPVP